MLLKYNLSMYSKIATIISSSFFGAGLLKVIEILKYLKSWKKKVAWNKKGAWNKKETWKLDDKNLEEKGI